MSSVVFIDYTNKPPKINGIPEPGWYRRYRVPSNREYAVLFSHSENRNTKVLIDYYNNSKLWKLFNV